MEMCVTWHDMLMGVLVDPFQVGVVMHVGGDVVVCTRCSTSLNGDTIHVDWHVEVGPSSIQHEEVLGTQHVDRIIISKGCSPPRSILRDVGHMKLAFVGRSCFAEQEFCIFTELL